MATAATGCISLAEELLRMSLADSAAFRTWVGASGDSAQAQALNRVHFESLPVPPAGQQEYTLLQLHEMRPYALIGTSGLGGRHAATGSQFEFRHHGSMSLCLLQDIPAEIANDPREIGRRFLNVVGGLMGDLEAVAGTAGYLAMIAWAIDESDGPGWHRSHPKLHEKYGDTADIDLIISWGPGG